MSNRIHEAIAQAGADELADFTEHLMHMLAKVRQEASRSKKPVVWYDIANGLSEISLRYRPKSKEQETD